jgi:hypothetical protein
MKRHGLPLLAAIPGFGLKGRMTLRQKLREAFSTAPPSLGPEIPRNRVTSALGTGFETAEFRKWMDETMGLVEIQPRIEHPGIGDDATLRRSLAGSSVR